MILGLSLTFSRHARFPFLIHTASLGCCFPLKSAICGLLKRPGEVVQQVVPQAISPDDPKKYLHNLSDSMEIITHTIHIWYIFTSIWLMFMVNVSKYTCPMDTMDYTKLPQRDRLWAYGKIAFGGPGRPWISNDFLNHPTWSAGYGSSSKGRCVSPNIERQYTLEDERLEPTAINHLASKMIWTIPPWLCAKCSSSKV